MTLAPARGTKNNIIESIDFRITVEKSSFEKSTFLVNFGKIQNMTIKHYYDDLKSADDLMSSNLHHKLSSVLRYIIPLVKDPEQKKELKDFYKKCEELTFANKGSEEYIVVSRLSYEVLEYIEDNLL